MAIAAIMARIMPESPSTDLEEIKKEARIKLEKEGALNLSFEERPIAFGLIAVIAKFAWKEEKSTDIVDSLLSSIPHVASAVIEDYRRAFG